MDWRIRVYQLSCCNRDMAEEKNDKNTSGNQKIQFVHLGNGRRETMVAESIERKTTEVFRKCNEERMKAIEYNYEWNGEGQRWTEKNKSEVQR